jgi:hypothetical protein
MQAKDFFPWSLQKILAGEHADTFLLIEERDAEADFDRHVRSNAFSAPLGALTLLNERPDVRINAVSGTAGMEKIKAVRAA